MTPPEPEVSIVIPTRNGAATLTRVVGQMRRQASSRSLEILAVDSGSVDDTLSILEAAAVRVHAIRPEEFGHARTRNLGASLARARKYVVFHNQDAVPADEEWLEGLIAAVESEPDVRAACATELDPAATPPFDVSGVARFVFAHSWVRGTFVMDGRLLDLWDRLPMPQLRHLFPFTTVSAIFERDYFRAHPFRPDVSYGEDLWWAVDAVRAGQKVACTSRARVLHEPPRTERDILARQRLDLALGVAVFGAGYRHPFARVAWALGLHRLVRWTVRGAHACRRFLRIH